MSDAEYQQFQELQHFDAASLRALALWLNTKKKNAALMKAVTAEMGRNARHMARAVDYFPPYFQDNIVSEIYEDTNPAIANDYLMLFEYAKAKREVATTLFAKYRFTTPLYQLRDIVNDARRNGHAAKGKTLAERMADLVKLWRGFKGTAIDYPSVFECADEIALDPAIAKVIAKRAKLAERAHNESMREQYQDVVEDARAIRAEAMAK